MQNFIAIRLFPAVLITMLFAACGGGGGGGGGGSSSGPAPTVTLTPSASSVASGSSVTLTWSSTNATSCTASGAWAGAKATSGSESVGPVNADASYALSCSGAGGSGNQTASVTVQPIDQTPPVIQDASPPTGTVSSVYPAFTFRASSGVAPLVWSETGTLPGLGVSLDGVLSGTPWSAGFFPITVNVKDSLNRTSAGLPIVVRVSLARPAIAFAPTGNMTIARSGHTATLLESGKVLVAGGPDASAELYDPKSGMFTATGSMTVARRGHTATLLTDAALPNHGKVLIVGGDATGTSAELYDPVTEIFTATGNATSVMTGHTATLLTDAALPNHGKVLIVAGGSTVAAELYDPASGTFTATGDLTYARIGHTATLLLDGRVLIAAGGTNGAELYDPAHGTFTATGQMSRVRSAGAMATRLTDGTVLIAGSDDTAELFDPAIGKFKSVGSMANQVIGSTANLLDDDVALIVGGVSSRPLYKARCGPTSLGYRCGPATLPLTVDRYVLVSSGAIQSFAPESEGFTVAGFLSTARHEQTTTVLADGTVLITGGVHTFTVSSPPTSAVSNVLSSAELLK